MCKSPPRPRNWRKEQRSTSPKAAPTAPSCNNNDDEDYNDDENEEDEEEENDYTHHPSLLLCFGHRGHGVHVLNLIVSSNG